MEHKHDVYNNKKNINSKCFFLFFSKSLFPIETIVSVEIFISISRIIELFTVR